MTRASYKAAVQSDDLRPIIYARQAGYCAGLYDASFAASTRLADVIMTGDNAVLAMDPTGFNHSTAFHGSDNCVHSHLLAMDNNQKALGHLI